MHSKGGKDFFKHIGTRKYESFKKGAGEAFAKSKINLEELSKLAMGQPEPGLTSGKQELFESLVNKYI